MAASKKKNLTGQETKNLAMGNRIVATEAEQEQLIISTDDSESANTPEILEINTSEITMNISAGLPGDQILDEEDDADSIINLDATLTIQHVVKLHEKLKKSYSANDTIEINASHVSSIDTATLQLLVALKKDAVKKQKEVIFAEPSQRFIESAELLGLLEILDIDA